jgi:hypothetical protein
MPRNTETSEVRSKLRIDDDDLDQCLVEQPEYFYQAAERATSAGAERDGLELELKELKAQLDSDIRKAAEQREEKLTETALVNRIVTLPKVKELQRKVLDAKRQADDAVNLKEAFVQRSYALKDLNAVQVARMYNLGLERGATGARQNIGDRNRAAGETARRERFRPRNVDGD